MKQSKERLVQVFFDKVEGIKELLCLADNEGVLSPKRREYASLIAVTLRVLLCHDSSGEPLIKSSGIFKKIIFPYRFNYEALNELNCIPAVQIQIHNRQCTLSYNKEIVPAGKVSAIYLGYIDWLSEVIVDIKHPNIPPMSRADVIKIVADKQGAHYDPKLDERMYIIENYNVTSVCIAIQGESHTIDCSNLFTETILSIASELCYSFQFLYNVRPKQIHLSDSYWYNYDFSSDVKKRKKYLIIKSPSINLFNNNPFHGCIISEGTLLHYYSIVFREKKFQVLLVDSQLFFL